MDPIKSGAIFKLKSPSTTPAHPPPPQQSSSSSRLSTWTKRSPQNNALPFGHVTHVTQLGWPTSPPFQQQQHHPQASTLQTPPPTTMTHQQQQQPFSSPSAPFVSSSQPSSTNSINGKNSMLKQSFDRIYRATPLPPNIDREIFRPPGHQPIMQYQQTLSTTTAEPAMITSVSANHVQQPMEYTPPRFHSSTTSAQQQQQTTTTMPPISLPPSAPTAMVSLSAATSSGRSPYPASISLPAHVQQRHHQNTSHPVVTQQQRWPSLVVNNSLRTETSSATIMAGARGDRSGLMMNQSATESERHALNRSSLDGKGTNSSLSTSSSAAVPVPLPPPLTSTSPALQFQSHFESELQVKPPPVPVVTVRYRAPIVTLTESHQQVDANDANHDMDNDSATQTSTIGEGSVDFPAMTSNHQEEDVQEPATNTLIRQEEEEVMPIAGGMYDDGDGGDYAIGGDEVIYAVDDYDPPHDDDDDNDGQDDHVDDNDRKGKESERQSLHETFTSERSTNTNTSIERDRVDDKQGKVSIPTTSNTKKLYLESDNESDATTRLANNEGPRIASNNNTKGVVESVQVSSHTADTKTSSSSVMSDNKVAKEQVPITLSAVSLIDSTNSSIVSAPIARGPTGGGGGGRGRGMRGMATDSLLAFIHQPIVAQPPPVAPAPVVGSGRGAISNSSAKSTAPQTVDTTATVISSTQSTSSREKTTSSSTAVLAISSSNNISSSSGVSSQSVSNNKLGTQSASNGRVENNKSNNSNAKVSTSYALNDATISEPTGRSAMVESTRSNNDNSLEPAKSKSTSFTLGRPPKTSIPPKRSLDIMSEEGSAYEDSDGDYEEHFKTSSASTKRGRGRPRKIRPEDAALIHPNANKPTKSGRITKPVNKLIDEVQQAESFDLPTRSVSPPAVVVSQGLLKAPSVKPLVNKSSNKPTPAASSSSSSSTKPIPTTSSISAISKKLLAQVGDDTAVNRGNGKGKPNSATIGQSESGTREWQAQESVQLYSIHAKTDVTQPNFWGSISQQLKQKGFNRTAQECEQKWYMSLFNSQQRREKMLQKQKATKITTALDKIQEISEQKVFGSSGAMEKVNNGKKDIGIKKNVGKDSKNVGNSTIRADGNGEDEEEFDENENEGEESIDKIQPTKKRRLGKNDLKVLAEQSAKAVKGDDIFDVVDRNGQGLSFKRPNNSINPSNGGPEHSGSNVSLNNMIDDALFPDISSPITTKSSMNVQDKKKNGMGSPNNTHSHPSHGNASAGPLQLFQSNHVHKIHTNRIRPQLIAPLGSKPPSSSSNSGSVSMPISGNRPASISQLQKKIGKAVDTVKRQYRQSKGDYSDGESLGDDDTEGDEEEDEEEYD